MLATGTGIAPFRGMVLDLLEGDRGPVQGEVHLVMGSPYTSDLLYHDVFRELAEKHANFHYHTVISREAMPDGRSQGYIHHYLDRQVFLHEDLLRRDRTLVYICGLAGMQTGVFQTMARLGVGGPYLKVKDELAGVDPADWTNEQIKRHVRPTHRCMLEVY
jgi:ferredoxin--NADP+ reductase